MKHLLEIDSTRLAFNGRSILSNIYLKCETGKLTGLLGRNGQGKSSLMQIIYGTLQCERSVWIDHRRVDEGFKRPDLLCYLPQFNFIPKNLSLLRVFTDYGLDFGSLEKRFPEFVNKAKITFGRLSGGEQRLIEIFIIVSSPSCFSLLDEPFTHLNPIQIEKVKQLLLEAKLNKGLLVTDQMFRHIVEISDNLYLLADGKLHLTKDMDDLERLGYIKL